MLTEVNGIGYVARKRTKNGGEKMEMKLEDEDIIRSKIGLR